MHRDWRERHLTDGKEVRVVRRDGKREDEVNRARKGFIDEIRSCQAGITGGYVDPELMRGQIEVYKIALEGLGRL